jgi:hypothetical protein
VRVRNDSNGGIFRGGSQDTLTINALLCRALQQYDAFPSSISCNATFSWPSHVRVFAGQLAVAVAVAAHPYTLAVVTLSLALRHQLPQAHVVNGAGNVVPCTHETIGFALMEYGGSLNELMQVSLLRPTSSFAWPFSFYQYVAGHCRVENNAAVAAVAIVFAMCLLYVTVVGTSAAVVRLSQVHRPGQQRRREDLERQQCLRSASERRAAARGDLRFGSGGMVATRDAFPLASCGAASCVAFACAALRHWDAAHTLDGVADYRPSWLRTRTVLR